jgi:putative PIN family toxin of toxin-antitoxin system
VRFVLDTAAMVAAIRSDAGASRRLLVALIERRCRTALVSVPLVIEYEAVLTRPEHLQAAHISAADVSTILDAVVSVAEPVRLAFLWRPTLHDPGDDMVLETAVNGHAEWIVTFNRKHFDAAATRFGIGVCTPAEAMTAWEAKR